MFDLTLRTPSTFLIAGPSQSGKTTWLYKVLQSFPVLFDDEKRKKVLYFFNESQPMFDNLKKLPFSIEFIHGVPESETIREKCMPHQDEGTIVILDDLMQHLNESSSVLFTTQAHHLNIVVFVVTQNLFPKNPFFRDISLNCTYVILFKNPRDASQIQNFSKQYAPGKARQLVNVFRSATKEPYHYLLIDNHQQTPEFLRLRSNILIEEFPIKVWFEKTSLCPS
jgi:hypothetical protein